MYNDNFTFKMNNLFSDNGSNLKRLHKLTF